MMGPIMGNMRKNANVKMLQDSGKLSGASIAGLQNIETLKATGRESDFFEQWYGYQTKMEMPNTITKIIIPSSRNVFCLPSLKFKRGNFA